MPMSLGKPVLQREFGDVVGISRPRVAQLISDGVLSEGATLEEWIRVYCAWLREQAAGRSQDLMVERAALAKAQRIGQEIKNAVAQGEYAPVGLLADVLGLASAAVAERLEALIPSLKLVWPDLPPAARSAIEQTVTRARNEWVAATAELVDARLAVADDAGDDEADV